MAPEIIEGTPYTEMVDHWALGVLTYFLLTGVTPFGDATTSAGKNYFDKLYNFLKQQHPI
jgi:serine/threonine protein kinase